MEQKIYWVDAFLDKIEYSNTDGSNRVTLTTLPGGFGLGVPYSLTLEGNFLYWTEWDTNSLYSVHKTEGGNVSQILTDLFLNPNGIQVVSASRRLYSEWKILGHTKTLLIADIMACILVARLMKLFFSSLVSQVKTHVLQMSVLTCACSAVSVTVATHVHVHLVWS